MLEEDRLHKAIQPLHGHLTALLHTDRWQPKLGGATAGLIEAGGGLLLGLFVKRVTSEMFIMLVLGASLFTLILWGWLVRTLEAELTI